MPMRPFTMSMSMPSHVDHFSWIGTGHVARMGTRANPLPEWPKRRVSGRGVRHCAAGICLLTGGNFKKRKIASHRYRPRHCCIICLPRCHHQHRRSAVANQKKTPSNSCCLFLFLPRPELQRFMCLVPRYERNRFVCLCCLFIVHCKMELFILNRRRGSLCRVMKFQSCELAGGIPHRMITPE